jgi:DNA-damage-inducible protein D
MPPIVRVLPSRPIIRRFKTPGIWGLYDSLRVSDIYAQKKLSKEQKILDHIGSEELGANLFRITQTEAKMRRDDPQGLDESNSIHYTVGKEVRETIEKIGGTMPLDLPTPEKSISQIEREQIKQLKLERKN